MSELGPPAARRLGVVSFISVAPPRIARPATHETRAAAAAAGWRRFAFPSGARQGHRAAGLYSPADEHRRTVPDRDGGVLCAVK